MNMLANLEKFKNYYAEIVLVGITILAFALRLYCADVHCFTYDETFTQSLALTNAWHIIYYALIYDCNTPTYYLLAHFSYILSGVSDFFVMRLPSIVFGTLFVPVVYYIGKEFHGKLLGSLCAFTVAISYPMIFYSQDARSYTLVFLLFGICTYYFLKIVNGDYSYIYLFTAFSGLCMWVHVYSFVPLSMLWIILLYKYQTRIIPFVAIMGIWCLPFIIMIHNQLATKLHETFGEHITDYLFNEPLEMAWFLSYALIPLIIYALLKYRTYKNLLLFTIIPGLTILVFGGMTFVTSIFPRYTLLTFPMVLCVAYYPVIKFVERFNIKQKGIILVLIVYGLSTISYLALIGYYFNRVCVYV
jgi:uncharacterized membrane protein